jgi:hypothetical protein
MCGLRGWSHGGEDQRVVRACSGLRLRRDTSLATTSQVLTACSELLSQVVVGGVLCRVRLLCSEVCSCGGVRFGVFCIINSSSYMT